MMRTTTKRAVLQAVICAVSLLSLALAIPAAVSGGRLLVALYRFVFTMNSGMTGEHSLLNMFVCIGFGAIAGAIASGIPLFLEALQECDE